LCSISNALANHAPVATAPDFTATHSQNIAASSLFSVTDADNDSITKYRFWDSTADPASGHFVIGGVAQGTNQAIDVTAAQLAARRFRAGQAQMICGVAPMTGFFGATGRSFTSTPRSIMRRS
jgi:hypothetical protein